METIGLNVRTDSTNILIGRKERKKAKKKEKVSNFFKYIKAMFSKISIIFLLGVIIALGTYSWIMEIKQSNLIMNLQKDPHIPSYVVDKVIDYLR